MIGPHGYRLASCPADASAAVVCVDLDRTDPVLDIALNRARPWRAGELYGARRVDDARTSDRMRF